MYIYDYIILYRDSMAKSSALWYDTVLIAQPHRFVLATSIIEAKCFHQMAHFELSITRVKYSSPLDFPLGACEASGRTSIATFLLPSLCERGC